MDDLIQAYFERDLSETEDEALQGLLKGSAEASQRFADLASQAYDATGAPEALQGLPWWKRRGSRDRRWLKWSALGLVVIGGWAATARFSQAPAPGPGLRVDERPFRLNRMPSEERSLDSELPEPPLRPGSASSRTSLAAVLYMPDAMAVRVDVLDSAGRPVRRLFQGLSPAGKQRYAWDGRLDSGGRAQPGDYVIEARAADGVQRRRVRLLAEVAP